MAEGESSIPTPFDVRTIKYLTRLMGRFDLTEIDLREGDLRIRLKREGKRVVVEENSRPAAPPAPAPATPQAAIPLPPTEPGKTTRPLLDIKSPTPGTFYAAPNADAEPYVRIGSRVQPETIVCIIEAMKVFNEIPADCSGVIAEVAAENQQPVEYGQVLFRVDPSA